MTAVVPGKPADTAGGLPVGGAMRVMGSETEYGIHAPSAPGANATMMSARVIQAYAQVTRQRAAGGAETRWDYTDEEPLHDARGWTLERSSADPEQLTDQPPVLDAEAIALAYGRQELEADGQDESGTLLMNMVLGNGARLYVDHAHPEYSSPEVTNPRAAVTWDAAGDLVALAAVRRLAADPELPPINLYKNNTDNKSVSYGSHENYLMPRSVPFGEIVRGLTPFFITRQIICGAGRVGLGQDSARAGYQISQRADFFETEVGLETTIRRPIINTRDEPHATADKYRRLHVIIGDANLSQASNFLKFGTTAMVLSLIEAGLAPRIEVHEPVAALQAVSHDTSLTGLLRLGDGRRISALDLQWIYFEAASKHAQDTGVADAVDGDGHTHEVLERWSATLSELGGDRAAAASSVEWLAKLSLLEGYRQRDGLGWDNARLGLVDLQWADIRPEKGLYYRLLARDRMHRIVDDAAIARAVTEPPSDTRAYFRGRCVSRFGADLAGASWDSVIFDVPGRGRLQRVPTREPLRGTEALTGGLFARHREAGTFLAELLGLSPGS
ncbi:depupylase/deamidase Dop [Arthrobacter sp. MW3 TE3886]|uniref:depupylase/deamidase Dop n=1 Tax=Arthrobacter sp. MW3 TE3886 TaxID=3156254 RepID=UPI003516C921